MPYISAYAKESILFQFNSPLGKGLEKVFADAIGFVNGIDYEGIPEKKWVSHRYTETHNYAQRVLFPQMTKVIKDTINLEVLKIIDVRQFSGMFAVDISLDSITDTIQILGRQTGDNPGDGKLSTTAKEMSEIYKNLNLETSRIDPDKFGKKLDRKISCMLYMDVDMAFLMLDNLPVYAVEPLTARELTAIYLHEIGHVITLIAQAGNAYQQFAQAKKHLERARGDKDLDGYLKVYQKDIRGRLQELVRLKKLNPKYLEATDALMEYSKSLINRRTDTSDYGWGTFEFLMQVIGNFIWLVALTFIRIEVMFFVYPLLRGLLWVVTEKPGEYGKTTDQSTNTSVYYHAERMADQYCARQGYGGDQASALVKLIDAGRYMELAFAYKVHAGSLRNSWVFANYLKVMSAVYRILRVDLGTISKDYCGPSNYEDDVNRLHRLLTDTAAVFKTQLSPAVRTYYLGEIEKIKRGLDDMKAPFLVRVSDAIWTYIVDLPMILKRITQMDDMEELEAMLRKLDTIVNNELYVQAAQFKDLASR